MSTDHESTLPDKGRGVAMTLRCPICGKRTELTTPPGAYDHVRCDHPFFIDALTGKSAACMARLTKQDAIR